MSWLICKQIRTGGLLVILLLLLAACAQNGQGSGQKADAEPAAAAQTRVYKDVLGREVTIPVRPQRIVALWTVGELLALGQKPVGAPENLLRYFSAKERSNITVVGDTVAADPEKVAALNPDLIIVFQRATPEDLEKFGKIAPTVATPFFGDAYERLRIIGDITGQPDKAEQWIASYEKNVTAARSQLSGTGIKGKKALVIQFALKSIYLYNTSTFPTVFDALEFAPTTRHMQLQKDESFSSVAVSQETLPEFDADYMFVIVNDSESQSLFDELKNSAVWKGLPAVKAGKVYEISNRISLKDVSTMQWALDELVPKLRK